MINLKGTFTALITPFKSDAEQSVDYDALEKLIEEQIEANVEGIVVLGTTGESPTITPEEHVEVTRFVIGKVKKRTLVIAGSGSNSTAEAITYSQRAKEDGADALLLVNPYYNKPTQEGLFQHFWKIAEEVDLPQIVYNIQGRTGVNVETSTLKRLAKHRNIVGVKEASGNPGQMMEVIQELPKDFFVLSGDDNLTFPLICLGGHGVISVLSNLRPKEVKAMVDLALSGDFTEARTRHYALLPLMKACFFETNPIPVKTVQYLQGKCENQFRLPMCPASPETVQKLKTTFNL